VKLSPLAKRAQRHERNKSQLDLNLVSLIDIFIILIFFLMFNATGVEILPNSKAVKLPESTTDKSPKETVVVLVSGEEILVEGRKVASVSEVMNSSVDVIDALKAELEFHASRQMIRKDKQDPAGKSVTIMGDKEIPYSLLRKVMVTCARADYSNISFAVLRKNKG
jgi:biopolymer transport protein TolR